MHLLASTWNRVSGWLRPKALRNRRPSIGMPARSFLDAYRRHREPSAAELLVELKGTAWTCASVNAAVCASFPPRLFVTTHRGEAPPKCLTRPLAPETFRYLRRCSELAPWLKGTQHVEEIVDHPLLTLLRQVNPVHNGFDLWELTQFYLEVDGCAYWLIETDPVLQIPVNIWILPAHQVRPVRQVGSNNLVDYYEYRGGSPVQRFAPAEIIHFRFPDPRDPYTSGLSPLRASYEQVALTSEYAAMKRALYDNTGLPSAVISPAEVLQPEEIARIEEQWNQKFQRGGAGRVLVSESELKVDVLSHSMGDLAALADLKATKEDIANAFHVPLPFLSGDTNLANMQAADHLHKTIAIRPRLRRRDEKLNEQLLPLYDDTGRLFLMSDDPTPELQENLWRQEETDLKYGVRTVNEIRSERGLPPVAWGDAPYRGPVAGNREPTP
jgi:HK97 family phage portal protein